MSFDIDWSLLNSLPTEHTPDPDPEPTHLPPHIQPTPTPTPNPLSSTLIELLNRQLATTSRPSFIGPITIKSLDFGQVGPEIEIRDIRDVWRAFDRGDDEGDRLLVAEDGMGTATDWAKDDEVKDFERREREREREREVAYPMDEPDGLGLDDTSVYSAFTRSHGPGHYHGHSRRPSVTAVGIGRDYISAMSPMLGHQNPSLSSQSLSTAPPPIPKTRLRGPRQHIHRHSLSIPSSPPTRSRSTNRMEIALDKSRTDVNSNSKADSSDSDTNPIPSLQLHLRLSHESDLHITLLTSLQVNYPSPLFMSLPLKLSITGLTLNGDVVLAYSGEKHRIHFCVVDEPDEGGGAGATLGQRLLPNLQIESEIGHADAHVLRNVGKVERFIADVVRKTLVDELVFPNFHTIAM
ncbi:MAG: Mitochondrial distribution and morphology protein 12 [Tremellales sp. Tagirdzhanova-0007]|nr:MAG: Mitochondrial distribution and morphology protein 12 [Tremellales sp. Tagirdzhanova-0007]